MKEVKYILKIEDELSFKYEFQFDNLKSLKMVLNDWLKTHDSGDTPVNKIEIVAL